MNNSTDSQKFQNQKQTQENKRLLNTIEKLWNTRIEEGTQLKDVRFYHVGSNVKTAKSISKISNTQKGVTLVLFETECGQKFYSYSVCLLQEKTFSRRLGVYYTLKNVLKYGVTPVAKTFPSCNFKEKVIKGYVTEDQAIVRALCSFWTTGKKPVDLKIQANNLKQYYKYTENMLVNKLLEQFDPNLYTVEPQFVHFRIIYTANGFSLITTAALNKLKSTDYQLLDKGGLTLFVVGITEKATNTTKTVFSLTNCLETDQFDKQQGRLFAIRAMAKGQSYEVLTQTQDDQELFNEIINMVKILVGNPELVVLTTESFAV